MYAWLTARFPPLLVDLAYVGVRAGLIVLIVMLADLPFGDFTYLNL